MVDYEFIKQMYEWGCDIRGYLAMGAITQADYDDIVKEA